MRNFDECASLHVPYQRIGTATSLRRRPSPDRGDCRAPGYNAQSLVTGRFDHGIGSIARERNGYGASLFSAAQKGQTY